MKTQLLHSQQTLHATKSRSTFVMGCNKVGDKVSIWAFWHWQKVQSIKFDLIQLVKEIPSENASWPKKCGKCESMTFCWLGMVLPSVVTLQKYSFASNWSSWRSHSGSLFTSEEQKKASSLHDVHGCHSSQKHSWCHTPGQNVSTHGHVFVTFKCWYLIN